MGEKNIEQQKLEAVLNDHYVIGRVADLLTNAANKLQGKGS